MIRKFKPMVMLLFIVSLVLSSSVNAFNDLPAGHSEDHKKITSLKERGIVQGDGLAFYGQRKLTYAEGIHLIVKGLDLSLAAYLFIKEPLASDSFDHVPNDAWYAQSFVIASVHGFDLPRDLNPKAFMTKEEFTYYLFTAMMMKGDFAFTKMLYVIEDDADINPDYRHSIQLMLNGQITTLDEKGKFWPKKDITRIEAAILLFHTIEFVHANQPTVPDDGSVITEPVTYTTEAISADVNKVTLSWGEQPNPGYRLTITKIVFHADQTAEIYYKLHYPEKDQMYAQVITTPTAETFLDATYKPVLIEEK